MRTSIQQSDIEKHAFFGGRAYCQRLKDLGDQLNDVDSPMNEQRIVLQLVRGLPNKYNTVGSYINQTIPSWETACSMLQLENQRRSARDTLSPPTVMAAIAIDSLPNQPYQPQNPTANIVTRRSNQTRIVPKPNNNNRLPQQQSRNTSNRSQNQL